MFTVGKITATVGFQLEDVKHYWLAICCYSGIPGLITGSLKLTWSQKENFALISVL